jgi:hypothetical protein
MALVLRRQYVQDRMEGREPGGYSVDDYAVVDGTRIGRIHREVRDGGVAVWLWSLQLEPVQPANTASSIRWSRPGLRSRDGGRNSEKEDDHACVIG